MNRFKVRRIMPELLAMSIRRSADLEGDIAETGRTEKFADGAFGILLCIAENSHLQRGLLHRFECSATGVLLQFGIETNPRRPPGLAAIPDFSFVVVDENVHHV